MGKNSSRNPLWPDWFDGEKIDEVTFCHELIRNHPMKCIENHFFTPDGPVEDEAELKQLILKEIQAFIIHGLSKKVSNLLESLRIIAYSAPLDIEVDCISLRSAPELPPIWKPSSGAATMSSTFWIRRAISAIKRISPSVPETSMRSTNCGVRTMPVTRYRRHGLVRRSAKTLSV